VKSCTHEKAENLNAKMAWHKIVIDTKTQLLKLFCDQREVFSAPVSTSRAGLGFEPGSFKTPTGLFRINEKIGQNARTGTVGKGKCEHKRATYLYPRDESGESRRASRKPWMHSDAQ